MAQSNQMMSLLCLYTIILFIATKFSSLSAITTNETDLEALLDIKNHIQQNDPPVLNSWNNCNHFCKWEGITCNQGNNRVTALNISGLQLVGTLSPFIGNLTFLEKIDLSDNSFHDLIPPEIGRLSRLQTIIFAMNSFQDQFPVNLTSCRDLQIIDLSTNKLTGSIPHQLSTLSKLYALFLDENNFTGNIPPALGNISTLKTLHLSENKLSGNIPHELGKLFNLQNLGLTSNRLSGTFPVEIYNISSILIIQIANNSLTGQFPDTMGLTLPKIAYFLAGDNKFSGSIPSTLANASGLTEISISFNMLTGPIPRNLGRLQKLQCLQIDNNPLDRANDINFIATLSNLTDLSTLSLGGIGIGGVLPPEIANLSKKLAIFELNDNYISGSLPEGIGELVGLTNFNVHGNTLSGSIPHSICKLTNLVKLSLSNNNFTGEIPPCIDVISGLAYLELENNRLRGNIPVSLRNITHLLLLNLSQNHLNGSFSKEVFTITSLTQLGLAQNKFTGSIPSEVGTLKNLYSLDVSGNELSGVIPMSIGGCEMLLYLQMEGNILDGTIPSSLGQLKSIEIIDLSRNKLSGQIPVQMENLTYIRTLNLSFNMLEGEVPRNGAFANTSTLSIVGNEKLCGGNRSLKLPACQKARSNTLIIIVLVICIPLALVSLFGCAYAIFRTRSSRREPYSTPAYEKSSFQVSYSDVHNSTNGFSSENRIGDGKYGTVYRGYLKPCEKVVAVKVLKLQLKGAEKSFLAECEALSSIRHRNLVKIITSCCSIDFKGNDFKALILEYVPNGSLDEWLHHENENPSKKLDLLERLNIAIDIASALDYLHNQNGTAIIHCDIKPSNVLLGNDLHAMVSDFGLAKFIPVAKDKSHDISSTGIRGTIGYVAPEYGLGGNVSAQGDIYSYGILLLEMFIGKRPTDLIENSSIHNYVKAALPRHVAEIIDPRLLTVEDNEETSRIKSCCLSILRIGISCSAQMKKERMDIDDALTQLQDVRNELYDALHE